MHPSFFDEVARQRGIARLESADAERLAALVRRERRGRRPHAGAPLLALDLGLGPRPRRPRERGLAHSASRPARPERESRLADGALGYYANNCSL